MSSIWEDQSRLLDYRYRLIDAPDKELLILRDAIQEELQERGLTK
jgi:hypothetical protein